jgi:hypothetical protein
MVGKATPVKEQTVISILVGTAFLSSIVVVFVWELGRMLLEIVQSAWQQQSIIVGLIMGFCVLCGVFMFILIPILAIIQRCVELVHRLIAWRRI